MLISPYSVREIDWSGRLMHINVNRQRVKDSPPYDPCITIDGAYEEKFLTLLRHQMGRRLTLRSIEEYSNERRNDGNSAGLISLRALSSRTIPDGTMLLGHAQGEPVLLARRGDELFAIGAICTHYGAPLEQGLLDGDTVRCQWHHACFSLRTGEALRAPALDPVSHWRVEIGIAKRCAMWRVSSRRSKRRSVLYTFRRSTAVRCTFGRSWRRKPAFTIAWRSACQRWSLSSEVVQPAMQPRRRSAARATPAASRC